MEKQQEIIRLRKFLSEHIVGQSKLLDRLMIGLITGGHILVEGLPGLAKTTSIKTLANGVHASFHRVQFTPDLLPGDLTGSDIYDPESRKFDFRQGPLFNEIVLADEINRAPAKVQSALLEAMQEHQISIGNHTHLLPKMFMVIATQNPIEQTGTYPLPEAQLDRFLMNVVIGYPTDNEELEILKRERTIKKRTTKQILTVNDVLTARNELLSIHIEEQLQRYIVAIVIATRNSNKWIKDGNNWIEVGASPRASLAISKAATAYAYIKNRDYVTPDDVLAVAHDCLRHRIILSVQALMEKVNKDEIIKQLLATIPVP